MKAQTQLIGGRWSFGSGGEYEVLNPATESPIARVSESSAGDTERAAQAARDAQPMWSKIPQEERRVLLANVARLLRERSDAITETIVAESGAVVGITAATGVPTAASKFERYADTDLAELDHELPPFESYTGQEISCTTSRAPVGVVACITPYNFPLPSMAGKIAPALAAGNTVVMKPAPQDPLAVIALAEICSEAGIPPGVVNLVTGSGPTPGRTLAESPLVDMISFTGSTQVGTRIFASAATTMKRLLLELGGKGPCIVCDDADLDAALKTLTRVWAFHSGQVCRLPTRAIVHRSLYPTLIERLADTAGHLKIGPPSDPSTVVGPVISNVQRHTIEGYIQSAIQEGGRLVCGGNRPPQERGYYVKPTLFVDCTSEMTIARNEVFGPVLIMMPFGEDSDAVHLANASAYGLYSYVFSSDTGRASRIASQLHTGAVSINTDVLHPEAPFGGIGLSGIGRDGGEYSVLAYTEPRATIRGDLSSPNHSE